MSKADTDIDIDELLRWAAEEVMGWGPLTWASGFWDSGVAIPIPNTRAERTSRTTADLTGWPGLGLAVEEARERDLAPVLSDGFNQEGEPVWIVAMGDDDSVDFLEWVESGRTPYYGLHPDPGIAGWLALREAMK